MCGYFCVGFDNFMLKGKILLDYNNLFYPNEYEMNEQIILKYSQNGSTEKIYSVWWSIWAITG